MTFTELFDAMLKNFPVAVAAVSIVSNGFLIRALLKEKDDHRETAVALAPTSQKLAEGVIALDRMQERQANVR